MCLEGLFLMKLFVAERTRVMSKDPLQASMTMGLHQKSYSLRNMFKKVVYRIPAATHAYQPLLSMPLMLFKGKIKADIDWHSVMSKHFSTAERTRAT